jgi:hypothetical protein
LELRAAAATSCSWGEVYDRAKAAPGDAAEESFTTRLRGLDSECRLARLTVNQGLRDHAAA